MWSKLGLLFILTIYIMLGVAFAIRTPSWQNPDEPAHFNYVGNIAEGRGLPILQKDDYDFDYLERIKAAKFPPDMSVDSIRYESHQPPLYYLVSTPVYLVTNSLPVAQQVIAQRFVSVFFGCLLLLVVYSTVKAIFPERESLSLATVAVVALLPQHVAMSAAINNDVFSELLLSLLLLLLVKNPDESRRPQSAYLITSGVVLGLILLTKVTIYIGVLIVPLALALSRHEKIRLARIELGSAFQVLSIYLVAALISGWWFIRNAVVYGVGDLLAMNRHSEVVFGQPATGIFNIAAARHFAAVTFKSFWLQLGWMGVPADATIYAVLALLTLLSGLGFILFVARAAQEPGLLSRDQRRSLMLLGATLFLIFFVMFLYNLQFIQPQGRYLFPAILPLGLFFVLGLREIFSPRYIWLLLPLLLLGLFLIDIYALVRLVPYLY